MTPRLSFSGSRTFAMVLLSAVPATACLQERRFDPPKPFPLPTLREMVVGSTVRFEVPKLEPLHLDGLLERPVAPPIRPDSVRVTQAVTTPELHAEFVAFVRRFEATRAEKAGVLERIGDAVALIHRGQHASAIDSLLAIEAENPGLHQTAVKLGLAYELGGELDQAVLWIATAIERNEGSPNGTDWLHLAIVRAKLKLRDSPEWLKNHTVLDGVTDYRPEEIVRAIEHQLGERLRFVVPADPVVCDLFYQAAIRLGGRNANERRAYYLRESLRFGEWRKVEITALLKT